MTDHLAHNIRTALAARRPAPSRDLALRLAEVMRRRRRVGAPALLAFSVAALALMVVVTRPRPSDDALAGDERSAAGPGAPAPAHPAVQNKECMSCRATVHDRHYTNQQCLGCHAIPTDVAFERERFAAKHATVQDRMTEPCLSCHVGAPTAAPPRTMLQLRSAISCSARVDGKLVGTTPVRVEVANGKHVVRIDCPGYEATTTTVETGAGDMAIDFDPRSR
jgi:hypothetical protein